MAHRVSTSKFNRDKASRKALFKSLSLGFFKNEKIETTLAKAKAARPIFEKMITTSKESTLANRRRLIQILGDKNLVEKLLSDIGPRFKSRNGGYTRIQRSGIRQGDGTQMAVISMVEEKKQTETKKVAGKSKSDNKSKTEVKKS